MKETSTATSLPVYAHSGEDASAEKALRISQAQVQALFEDAPMGIFLLDADFRICQVNPAARPAFGDIPDLIGKDFDEVMHILWEKNYADEVVKIYRHTLETGETFYTPERIEKRLDRGVIEVYEWRLNRILMPDGRFGVVCYFRDVSQQVLARLAVEESEQRMRLITESVPGLIAYVDAKRRYGFVNIAYEQWFGCKRGDVVGKHLWEVLGETAYQSLLPKIERVFAGEELHFEQWVPYKDGGSRFVSVSYLPDKHANGEVQGYYALIVDLTERYRHERKMNCLVELSDLIRRAERVNELLNGICEITAKQFEASHCVFCEIDFANNRSEVKIEYRSIDKPSVLGTYHLSDYPKEQVAAHLKGQPVVVEDAKIHPLTQPIYEEAFEPFGLNSFISQPILRNGTWVGLLSVNNTEPRPWTEDHINFLGIIAERTWTAIEKLRSEEALRRSEQFHKIIAESSSQWAWSARVEPDGTVVTDAVSEGYTRWLGYTLEELMVAGGWQALVHPDDLPTAQSQVEQLLLGKTISGELRQFTKGGNLLICEYITTPVKDETGRIVRLYGASRDVTERKRYEAKLHLLVTLAEHFQQATHADELLQTVCELTAKHFDVTHCVFSQVDQQQDLVVNVAEYRNGEVPSLLGSYRLSDYPAATNQALSEGQIIEVVDTKTDALTADSFETMYAPLGVRAVMAAPVMRNRQWVGTLFINHGQPRHWNTQQMEFLSIIAERTWLSLEKLCSEQALRESEARFRMLADSAPTPIWVNGLEGCEFVNKAYLEFFGVRMEEVLGYGWAPLLHPDDKELYVHAYLEAFKTRAPFRCQTRVKNGKDTYRWIDSMGMPRFSAASEFLGYVGTSPDITEIKEAQQILQERNKELEYFAYLTSHDLQEPVNTIGSFIQLIESELSPDDQLNQYVGFIKQSCQRMSRLITDLLEHSRIGRSSQPQPVDLAKLVREVMLDLERSVKAKAAKIEVGEMPTLIAYPTEMRLLFQNLVSNALKFQHPNHSPHIRISAQPEGKGWHFIVEDNGIGIEPKFHERIFTIFQRLHSAHQFEGTGIGLAHSRKIVELHEGRIWVESEAGAGSSFHFIIREPVSSKK